MVSEQDTVATIYFSIEVSKRFLCCQQFTAKSRPPLLLWRQILAEIRAPGIDVNRDVVKAVRKIPAKPPNTGQPILGTVLVEMKNEESRASIMKNKHSLQNHPDDSIKRVIIKNMKSREQMMIENLGNNLLKRIPGCQNIIVRILLAFKPVLRSNPTPTDLSTTTKISNLFTLEIIATNLPTPPLSNRSIRTLMTSPKSNLFSKIMMFVHR